MVTFDFTGLLVVAAVAFVAPLLAGLVPGRLLPAVVLEVLLGLAVGPQGLGWVTPQGAVELLYFMGLGFLLFLAGQEIDPKHFSDPMAGDWHRVRDFARPCLSGRSRDHVAGNRLGRPPARGAVPDLELIGHRGASRCATRGDQ